MIKASDRSPMRRLSPVNPKPIEPTDAPDSTFEDQKTSAFNADSKKLKYAKYASNKGSYESTVKTF